MKKIISFLLSLMIIISAFSMDFSACAVSLSQGTQAIRDSFKGGMYALDFVYYSPVKKAKDKTKYPLVLWLHGNSSGNYPGHQLENSDIHKFASDEFQARFHNGGAFILLPRDSTTDPALAWDMEIDNAKSTLDSFIKDFSDNIDLTRIYVGGNSMGGKGAYIMAASFPDVFAAVFPVSPVYIPSNTELRALKNTAVWIFSNSHDEYPQLYPGIVETYFGYLNSVSVNPGNNRWTCFDTYYRPDGSSSADEIHNTWTAALNDMFMDNRTQYLGSTTVDGSGNTVQLKYPNGLISWLSAQTLSDDAVSSSKRGLLTRLIEMFVNIINAIISLLGV